jgi:hypothetical protein
MAIPGVIDEKNTENPLSTLQMAHLCTMLGDIHPLLRLLNRDSVRYHESPDNQLHLRDDMGAPQRLSDAYAGQRYGKK